MDRGPTGRYTGSIAGGVKCQAFIPNPLPPSPALQIGPKLQSRINQAMLALGRLDAVSTLLPDASLFIYSYVRKEAVMSSQIEGTQSSLSDLMLYEMDAVPSVPMDDVQEVSCYVSALYQGVQRIREGEPITFRLLTDMHRTLMTSGRGVSCDPGVFRKNQVWIGGHRADEATFVPPPSTEIADCWSALEQYINDVPDITDPVIKAAFCHVQFETIHPFTDGNGRLGRLLIPLILVEAKVIQQPLLYLSVFFKRHRHTYYERLNQVRLSGDWEAWLLFFVDALADTATAAVHTAQQLHQLLQQDRQRLSEIGRLSGSAIQVLNAMVQMPIASVNRLVVSTGLTAATVGKALDVMEKDLAILKERTGQKRNRLYVYTDYLVLLNQD